ncbi:MAG: hypothetical protein MJ059_01945 [Lachnospiraceae bacterium]|nr:hypothetical protein [Lachnospiraceae bacterium]
MEGKKINVLKRILITALQLTWGLPQTVVGLIVFLYNIKEPHEWYRGSIRTVWRDKTHGVSMGLFIFTCKGGGPHMTEHEYGHCMQSLILGPLYLIVIGLPSVLWCNSRRAIQTRSVTGKNYYSFFTEKWAEKNSAWLRNREREKLS